MKKSEIGSLTEFSKGTTRKPNLIDVEAAKRLDLSQVLAIFRANVNPGQLHFMKLVGFDEVLIERAEGMYYMDRAGRRILDMFGGFGSLALGHNHPRLLAA